MGETQLRQSLFFRIDRGIGQFNNDYYAVLGVPIDAPPALVRQNYLRIARRLHPDVYGLSPAEKEIATQFLAKLVNPAYNALMRPQEREAYQAIFKLLVRRLMMKERQVEIFSELAQKLLQSPSEWLYQQSLEEVAACQYANIEHILECSAQLSELNLVYIFHKYADESTAKKREASAMTNGSSTHKSNVLVCANQIIKLPKVLPIANLGKPVIAISGNNSSGNSSAKPLPKLNYVALPPLSLVKSDPVEAENTVLRNRRQMISLHQRFATSYMNQGQWLLALKELRSLLQLDPQNLQALTLMAVAHRQLSQWSLAKETFAKAQVLDPNDPFITQQLEMLSHIVDNCNDITSLGGDHTVLQEDPAPVPPPLAPESNSLQGSMLKAQPYGNRPVTPRPERKLERKLPVKMSPPPPEGWWVNLWKNLTNRE